MSCSLLKFPQILWDSNYRVFWKRSPKSKCGRMGIRANWCNNLWPKGSKDEKAQTTEICIMWQTWRKGEKSMDEVVFSFQSPENISLRTCAIWVIFAITSFSLSLPFHSTRRVDDNNKKIHWSDSRKQDTCLNFSWEKEQMCFQIEPNISP